MNETSPWSDGVARRPDDLVGPGTLVGGVSRDTSRETLYGETAPSGRFVGRPDHPDDYELISRGLQGGEGITWQARYTGRLPNPVDRYAVKEVVSQGATGEWPTQADLHRWWDDLHLLRTLNHPHLVAVHDAFVGAARHERGRSAGLPVNTPYILMEWVPGLSLHEIVKRGEMPFVERLVRVTELASALAALHSQTRTGGNATLHRDVKPDNAVVDPRRGLVLVDVGGLRRLGDGFDPRGMHTRAYTAPEVMRDPSAPREVPSDLFALGGVAHFVVTGNDPGDVTDPQVFRMMTDAVVRAARDNGVEDPSTFAADLMAMLDPEGHRRPPNGVTWAARLLDGARARRGGLSDTTGAPDRPQRRGRGVLIAAGAAAVVLAAGALLYQAVSDGDPAAASPAAAPASASAADEVLAEDYTGLAWSAVRADLASAGVAVSRVDDPGSIEASGTVVGQSIAPGRPVGAISITVSTGEGADASSSSASTSAAPSESAPASAAPGAQVAPAEAGEVRTEPGILITDGGKDFDTKPPSNPRATYSGENAVNTRDQGSEVVLEFTHLKAPWNSPEVPTEDQCSGEVNRRAVQGYVTDVEVGDGFCFTTEQNAVVFGRVVDLSSDGVLLDTLIWDAED